MAVVDAHVFPGFLTSAEVRGENTLERNFASNCQQPPGHEPDTLTTEPSGWSTNELFSIKRRINGSAKGVDPGQPAQVDLGQHFLLSLLMTR